MGSNFKWNFFALVVMVLVLVMGGSPSFRLMDSVFSFQYGSAVALVGSQSCPSGIDVDAAGTLYWVNYCSGQLLKLRKDSAYPTTILSGLNGPYGVGVDGAGDLYFDEYYRGVLSRLTPNSTSPQVLLRGLDYPNFMTVDEAGNVYFITGQTCGNKIVRYDEASHDLATVLEAPQPHDVNHGFGGIYLTSAGDLYYTTCDSSSLNLLHSGSSTPIAFLNVTGRTTGIAVDGVGNVFYALYNSSISELPRRRSTPIVLSTQGSSRLQLTIDKSGNLYYTDNIGGRIWTIALQIPTTNTVTSVTTTTVTSTAALTSTALSTITFNNQTNSSGPSTITVTSVAYSTQTRIETPSTSIGFTTEASTMEETVTQTSIYTEFYAQGAKWSFSSLTVIVLLLAVAFLSAYLVWSSRRRNIARTQGRGEQSGIETVDEIVLKYVRDHGGEISISGACADLGISEAKLRESLARLTDKGSLSK